MDFDDYKEFIRENKPEDAEFSDEEDEVLFGQDNRVVYFSKLRRVKHNALPPRSHRRDHLHLNGNNAFSTQALARVGLFLGNNTHLKVLYLSGCELKVEDLRVLMDGLRRNNSLSQIDLSGNGAIGGAEGMAIVASYVDGNNHLKELELKKTGLREDGLSVLVPALNKSSVRHLHLEHNQNIFNSEGNSSLGQLNPPELSLLSLDGSNIGREGCLEVAKVLKNRKQTLKKVNLRVCKIDYEGIQSLAEALEGNDVLKELLLNGNADITSVGWDHIAEAVCNTSSIEATYLSNHTLRRVGYYRSVSVNLTRVLIINTFSVSPTVAGRKKVALVQFGGGDKKAQFHLDPIIDLDIRLMPRVLAWVGSECGFYKLHHVVRNWNNPQLFGYPSPDRVRIAELKKEAYNLPVDNDRLRGENKLVGDLKNRNLELEDENVALKARIQSMEGDVCRPPKRQRE
ncbi:predicted protein [Thalassiosira pseudonana CCMP1335]|uniref:Uncharacterized protein n=1 Tax=Thalassiosira pseudonana TaxID=35128 RepID=B8C8N8_THAPS|nr:predicted protein [Thalassiosira pseudonana CCMP1335]EED90321.1 predicted protein [Thalassiosira pseudonana CCMP1335]